MKNTIIYNITIFSFALYAIFQPLLENIIITEKLRLFVIDFSSAMLLSFLFQAGNAIFIFLIVLSAKTALHHKHNATLSGIIALLLMFDWFSYIFGIRRVLGTIVGSWYYGGTLVPFIIVLYILLSLATLITSREGKY